MTDLLVIGLTNLLMAAPIAVLAYCVGRFVRRPALAHGLWLLVFLKLITPPLVRVPVPWPQPAPVVAHSPQHAMAGDDELPNAVGELLEIPAADLPPVEEEVDPPDADFAAPVAIALAEPAAPTADAITAAPLPWAQALVAFWVAGAGLLSCMTVLHVRRFQTWLRHATPANDFLQAEAQRLADRMGVRCPCVWLVPGMVSPMLWTVGTARRLLLPHDLLARLSRPQQSTLIAHELAHLRRGDHWVRYLEIAVLCLYWWCPLVWWARRGLHEAEEECCDAWVVWALPHLARDYALALVETLDFLCEVKTATPALASGIRNVPLLRRRLTMIMRGSSSRVLTAVGGIVLLGLAAVLLPLLPSVAQEQNPPQGQPPKEKKFNPQPRGEQGGPELRRLQEQLEELAEQRRQLEKRAKELQRALEEREGNRPPPQPGNKPFERKPGEPGPNKPFPPGQNRFQPGQGPGQSPIDRRLHELENKLDRLMEIVEDLRRQMERRPFPPGGPPGGLGPKGPPFGKEQEKRQQEEERRGGGEPQRPEFRQPINPRPFPGETPEKKEKRPERPEG